jgi:hypothetical protein
LPRRESRFSLRQSGTLFLLFRFALSERKTNTEEYCLLPQAKIS